MHRRKKKKPSSHFVTGVTEMDDGYVRDLACSKKTWKYCLKIGSYNKCANKYLKDLLAF